MKLAMKHETYRKYYIMKFATLPGIAHIVNAEQNYFIHRILVIELHVAVAALLA